MQSKSEAVAVGRIPVAASPLSATFGGRLPRSKLDSVLAEDCHATVEVFL